MHKPEVRVPVLRASPLTLPCPFCGPTPGLEKLESEPALANANLKVKTDEQSVILTGTVISEKQHDLALRIAQSYAVDRNILDKIKVRQ